MFFFVTCSDQTAEEKGSVAVNATALAGNATLPAGNATLPAGNATLAAGNATLPASNATLPATNATPPAGNATLPFSNATVAPESLDLAGTAETEAVVAPEAADKALPEVAEADKAVEDKAAADKAAADKAAADKAAADKAAADKAAADKAAAKAAADKAAADKAAADKAASEQVASGAAASRFAQDKATGKIDQRVVEETERAEEIVESTNLFRGKGDNAAKTQTAEAGSRPQAENISVTPPKSGAETGSSSLATTQMAAAANSATSQALAAGQDPVILSGLQALALKRVSVINSNIQPNRSAAHVTQISGMYVAQYYYVPEESIRVSYRGTEPGTPFQYAGKVCYRECLYESRGSTKEEALSGQFAQVSTKNMTEIMRYVGNVWKE